MVETLTVIVSMALGAIAGLVVSVISLNIRNERLEKRVKKLEDQGK